ncbi:hypothetical protein F2Q69_00044031 [Brassica cretica]|uniref:Uncharacterized protein n=1 Tax=Brassica cretica TaxID=69181 RepID=A0A8S9NBS6_BRACR|nr:hypothetical protein F2Q69_00044031 [Brassica cretica]
MNNMVQFDQATNNKLRSEAPVQVVISKYTILDFSPLLSVVGHGQKAQTSHGKDIATGKLCFAVWTCMVLDWVE